MGGKLLLSILTAKDGYTDHVMAEVIARNIPTTNKKFKEEYGEGLDTVEKLKKKKINFTKLKALVKVNEAEKMVTEQNNLITLEDALKKVSAIVPSQSNELITVHKAQTEVIEELHLE